MNHQIEIRDIDRQEDLHACYALMLQLRPHLQDSDAFAQQVRRQREQGFRLSGAWQGDQIIGAIGYRLQENLLYGSFVFVDDLIVDEQLRSRGIGALLLDVARAYAQKLHCRQFVLDTGLHMALAQRFYYRQGLLAHAMGFHEELSSSTERSGTAQARTTE
jgi:ribosomal protein S18 acetylase RimI-like enzyme